MEGVNSVEKRLPESGNKFRIQDKGLRIKHIIFVFCLASCFLPLASISCAHDIKQPNVAGAFYPDSAVELSQMIDIFLKNANPEPVEGEIFVLISPHAGYDFSGPTAAYGYKLIKNRDYKIVIIIGPSHYYGFAGFSVYNQGAFQTPLGDIVVDNDFANQLISTSKDIKFIPEAFQKEHSIEVQIPFLQKTLSNFKIVPIVIGQVNFDLCWDLAKHLVSTIGNRKDVLIIASTDMYHGFDFEEAEVIDKFTLSILEKMDPQVLYEKLKDGTAQFCGGTSVVVAMLVAKDLGHNKLKVLKYTNSAQVTGRKIKGIWTVGYTSCIIDQEKGEETMLNNSQRKRLLILARQSIEHYLKTGKKLEVSETDSTLTKKNGAFVTLHEHGQLRGCIGNLIGNQPLYLTIRDMAVEAAVGDPRFPPLTLSELKDIDIEISVLSELERINDPLSIELGVHGVLIKRGFHSGVFLPQVATETGWSREEFLSYLCSHKAGLSADAWKDKVTEIYVFTAEVFSEKSH